MEQNVNKSYVRFKIIQLIIFIIFSLGFFIYLNVNPVAKDNIYTNRTLMTICEFLWIFVILDFGFIVFDLVFLEKNVNVTHTLHKAAYLDSLTGIPNRQSCDIVFEQYEKDKNIEDLGCCLVSITNLSLINEMLGRANGNLLLQEFASVFETVGDRYGFVGRNGGNEFLIVIENCTKKKMDSFLKDFSKHVQIYNEESSQMPVDYKAYSIINEELKLPTFGDLISNLYKQKGSAENA